jgi:hypothetical protein
MVDTDIMFTSQEALDLFRDQMNFAKTGLD